MFIEKTFHVPVNGGQDGKYEIYSWKTWSEEAIDTLIKCFQPHECTWNVISGDYKDQNKSLSIQKKLICQCKNGYDYKKLK